MREIEVDATLENLAKVFDFLHKAFDDLDVDDHIRGQVKMCVEEIYMNITHYAYNPEIGLARVAFAVDDEIKPAKVIITLSDKGKPYDPMTHEDPDLDLDLDDMPIGGLGIYLVKSTMDRVEYELKDGRNVLTMEKRLV